VKHLLLLRHAKAVAGGPGMADRERPLTTRGHRDAALMGAAIAADGPPDIILCSPARRTRETLAAVMKHFPAKPEVVIADDLYGPSTATCVGTIAGLGRKAKCLLVFGHNPTIHATALLLAGAGDKQLRAGLAAKFPTAALAVLAFKSGPWSAIREGSGELISFRRPRDLGASDADD